MKDVNDDYRKEQERENLQFLLLCGRKDAKILVTDTDRDLEEHVRLACIALILNYKKLFMKIVALVDDMSEKFIDRIKRVKFEELEGWMNDFIKNVPSNKARDLVNEIWLEIRKTLDFDNFEIKRLIQF